jgi:hypothetical protein
MYRLEAASAGVRYPAGIHPLKSAISVPLVKFVALNLIPNTRLLIERLITEGIPAELRVTSPVYESTSEWMVDV